MDKHTVEALKVNLRDIRQQAYAMPKDCQIKVERACMKMSSILRRYEMESSEDIKELIDKFEGEATHDVTALPYDPDEDYLTKADEEHIEFGVATEEGYKTLRDKESIPSKETMEHLGGLIEAANKEMIGDLDV